MIKCHVSIMYNDFSEWDTVVKLQCIEEDISVCNDGNILLFISLASILMSDDRRFLILIHFDIYMKRFVSCKTRDG